MSHEIVLLLRAEVHAQRIYQRYEEIDDGNGDRFLGALEQSLALLADHPFLGRKYRDHPSIRRILVRNFPVAAFYVVEGSRVMVRAILDMRMDHWMIERELDA